MGQGPLARMIRHPYRVHYVFLPANDIFGMVGRCGGGYNSVWADWSDLGRSKREIIMKEYEEGLDAICGHYKKLEDSILKDGFRNPIIITCGRPKKRVMENLPPEMRELPPRDLLLLETTMGGSRLHVAQKHNMKIPCIVNDWCGRFLREPEIVRAEDARQLYKDPPQGLTMTPDLGLVESFGQHKVGYHLGPEWSEDRLMPVRAPLWVGIMNRHGYRIEKLPKIVLEVLARAGVDQDRLGQ